MATAQQTKKEEAQRKGVVAAATAAGSAVAIAAGAPFVVGAAGLGVSAYLGYKWIRFRIENSIRF